MVRELCNRVRCFVCRSISATALFAAVTVGAEVSTPLDEKPFAPRSGPRGSTLFAELSPEATGIVTENRYEDPSMWMEHYAEFAVGAVGTGVAIGDYDGDGRPDVFVVSKTESCRLFRNLGNWKFEDVTDRVGVGDRGAAAGIWKQGATFTDVNNDWLLDLYVCRFNAPNLLYINGGNGTFHEEAAARGLAVNDASVMAAFCDYDRDGWLDVFVQTNSPESAGQKRAQRNYLFHNDRGAFVDVTERAGIGGKAQGHSATWWDYDDDGWPDLYVANDFTPADQLYRNNHSGTFTDTINSVIPHMPFSSMGADLGDVNNDGLIDLLVADMAATNHQKDQRTMANARLRIVEPAPGPGPAEQGAATVPYYMRNMLYLGTGTGRVLEAGFLTGLAATDWTWSVRFEDLDNDGRLDLHVTNGMYREPHNADLMDRIAAAETPVDKIRIERASPVLAEQNLVFRNLGDLRFEDASAAWGLAQKGVSFGAAFGDLDGDGDLDLVYANYKKGVTILRNDSDTGHRVSFVLHGTRSNRLGVGATVRIETASGLQVRQLVLARGVVSSSEPVLHFGLGEDARIRRVTVAWPSGQSQVFTDLSADRKFTITEPEDSVSPPAAPNSRPLGQFVEVSESTDLSMVSREPATDANVLPSLPASAGAAAAADFDHDGRVDAFIGGRVSPENYPFALKSALLANRGGRFEDATDALAPGLREVGMVTSAVWSDADGDGWSDLLLTLEWGPVKYFHNDQGRGFSDWTEKSGFASAGTGWWSSIATADFNGDGRPDYVVGNLGLNTQYHADPAHPALLFAGDFSGDGSSRAGGDESSRAGGDGARQLVEAYYEGDKLYPWRTRKELGAAIPSILKRYPRNDLYAKATLGEILGDDKMATARRFTATEFRSGVLLSQPDATYRFEALPRIAQIAPLRGLAAGDFDGDGRADIYAVQNCYAPLPPGGRFDGGLSQLLRGDGRGHFAAASLLESGLAVPGDAKALAVLDLNNDGWADFVVSRNNSTTLAFQNKGVAGRHSLSVRLQGPKGNPAALGARITLELDDGSRQTSEVVAGSGYYSQSASVCFFGWAEGRAPRKIRVRWPTGEISEHNVARDAVALQLSAPSS